MSNQIAFRYHNTDTEAGVTRATAQRLARILGVDETQVIHRALRELSQRTLPRYAADDGPLSAAQLRQVKRLASTGKKRSVRGSIVDLD